MTDIVERLRRTASLGITNSGLMKEAADKIERLRAKQGTEDDMANAKTCPTCGGTGVADDGDDGDGREGVLNTRPA